MQLWRELAVAGNCKDQHLIDELLVGMNIVGDVAKSGRWPPLEKTKDAKPVQHLINRAWEMKQKINGHLRNTRTFKADLGGDH